MGYIVTLAGTTEANGTYVSYGTSDGVADFKHLTNTVYLYRGTDKVWYIGPTEGGLLDGYYSNASVMDTPPKYCTYTTDHGEGMAQVNPT